MPIRCTGRKSRDAKAIEARIDLIVGLNDEHKRLMNLLYFDETGMRKLALRYMENKMPIMAGRIYCEIANDSRPLLVSDMEDRKTVLNTENTGIIVADTTIQHSLWLGGTNVQELELAQMGAPDAVRDAGGPDDLSLAGAGTRGNDSA